MIQLATLILAVLPSPSQPIYDRVSAAGAEVLLAERLAASGWVADPEGRVVTAAHALWGKKGKVEVVLGAGTRLPAEIEGFDLGHDLALLRLPARGEPYAALQVAAEPAKAGAEIHLYGAAQFRHGLLLPGRVARADPSYEYLAEFKTAVRVLHIAGPGPSGTSGGCWVDSEGRVVANQSGAIVVEGRPSGIAFAAPADAIRRLVKARASAETADAGIVVEERSEHGRVEGFPSGAEGVFGVLCREGGPAKAGGLEPWFLVLAVDGRTLGTRDAFYGAVRSRKPGEILRLDVRRKGAAQPETLELRLARLEGG
jgi:S1-C subfamily serine protease